MDSLYQQFVSPSSEFSPMPFWFWNDHLDKEKLQNQIKDFQEKGVEGFVLHPRIGIPEQTKYLSDDFMEYVKFAVEEADRRNMHVILYDEAMYPSGAANGKVVERDPTFASRGLFAKVIDLLDQAMDVPLQKDDRLVAVYLAEKNGTDSYQAEQITCLYPLNAQVVHLYDEKVMISEEVIESYFQVNSRKKEDYSCIFLVESYTQGTIRGIHKNQDDGQYKAPRSTDLLNPAAVKAFIEITHERYKEVVGDYFGNTIFAMFTDEPDITGRNAIPGCLAWTNDFEKFLYHEGLHIEDLPGLFFDIGEKTKIVKQTYEKAINKRMLETYYNPIAEWCDKNNLFLTGHPAKSDDIGLLKSFSIPGQDVVWRWVAPEKEKGVTGEHSTAAKCGSDAARHYNRRRNLNEYLGVCGIDNSWNLSASDMKWYTDWLAVRGVNLFCPHAFYYSVKGRERSHERPPDVGPNNVWWPYYKYFSTYIKRISWLMTDSVNQAEIAILTLNNHIPWKMAKYFYEHQIEFNYLHESLFVDHQIEVQGDRLLVGQQSYHLVVLDNMDLSLFNPTVVEELQQFVSNGGKVYQITDNSVKEVLLDVIYLSSVDRNQLEMHFSPYRHAILQGESHTIRMTKIKKAGRLFYFIVNEGDVPYKGNIQFSNDQPTKEWNPWTGDEQSLIKENEKEYLLDLSSREAIIWCVEGDTPLSMQKRPIPKQVRLHPNLIVQERGWNRSELRDWSTCEDLKYYSGTIEYQYVFENEGDKLDEVVIDLGTVYEIAEVTINQSKTKVKMWAPYHLSFSGELLKQGENLLRVRVTNNSANQMDKESLRSGLIGPVSIKGILKKKKD
ncbi:glycosylhydrolase-like jelly roll fold domain-containing protein [Gracilibacillus saliphilus]|uniref:glycosylhydrolase-like jelly roll fold domain-containing protein n=1 Tax=Gracilibacillus saliphilus TaxID=543890 RepID=UPI0013D2B401|nr:glycosylhydrolase-like jelly roll fold domain-containing protein [Gracilibacillus saliphilus]